MYCILKILSILITITFGIVIYKLTHNRPTDNDFIQINFASLSIIDIINTLIASIAFVISLFNFLNEAKPAEISFFVSENAVIIANSKKIGFHIPITSINESNNMGVITKCELNVIDSNKNEFIFNWTSFCKDEGGNWEDESQIYSVAVGGKDSIKKVITFFEDDNNQNRIVLEKGEYKLLFKFYLAGQKKAYKKNITTLKIDSEKLKKIQDIKEHCTNPHKFEHIDINIITK